MKRPDLPPNPFNREESFAHRDLERLFDKIDDVQRNHRHGRKEPKDLYNAAIDASILQLQSMKAE